MGGGLGVCRRGEEAKKKKKRAWWWRWLSGGSCSLNIQQARTHARTHKCRRTTSEIPAPPSHTQKDPWRGSDWGPKPSILLPRKICIRLNAQAERGACAEWGPWRSGLHSQHRRSDDRHARCPPPPPQQMMGITRSRRMRTQRASVASLNLYKLRVTVENPIFWVHARFGGWGGGGCCGPMTPTAACSGFVSIFFFPYLSLRLGAEDVKTDPRSEQRRSRL